MPLLKRNQEKVVAKEASVPKDAYVRAVQTILRGKESASDELSGDDLKILNQAFHYGMSPQDCASEIVHNRSAADNATEWNRETNRVTATLGRFMFTHPDEVVGDFDPLMVFSQRTAHTAALKNDDFFDHKKLGLKLLGKKSKVRCMDYLYKPKDKLDSYAVRQHLQTRGYVKVSKKSIRGPKGTVMTVHLYSHPNKMSAVTVVTNADKVEKLKLHRFDKSRKILHQKEAAKLARAKRRSNNVVAVTAVKRASSDTIAPSGEDKIGHMIIEMFGGATTLSTSVNADSYVFTKYGVSFDLIKPGKNGANRVSISVITPTTFRIKYLLVNKSKKTSDIIKQSPDLTRTDLLANFTTETGIRA